MTPEEKYDLEGQIDKLQGVWTKLSEVMEELKALMNGY